MINNVVLVGRLAADPDLRFTSSGSAVTTFRLAVNRNFTNQEGNREADFINCVIWRKPAETLANYAKKGTLLGVTGRIQTRNYENQQGNRIYVTEVVCETFQLLESRRSDDNSQYNQNTGVSNSSEGNYSSNQNNTFKSQDNSQPSIPGMSEHGFNTSDPFSGSQPIDIADGDLPF
ncbi:single-stranded DNA-binding protein [Enterococcus termitis]|uniref:Single-stranded DNA-binding protein n=1 Tax=Enterococcus termitis TaxID=332950 RepID=A0A1E5GZL2_9ENTE|nr:single-stranded DNA-binding protein [Enterococcus termitis]OEG18164.1 single-stranded DNA-binding protein [Enterococcus termitis]OJG97199.1 single-strand DNA-binding protein [Enterococcus termitis]